MLTIIVALTYTLGHRPCGYAGLGDLSAWLFFSLLAVLGSYCLHGAPLTPALLLPAGVLNVNNAGDIDSDRASGKHTLPVRLGLPQVRIYHLLPAMLCCAIQISTRFALLLLLPLPAASSATPHDSLSCAAVQASSRPE